jgi:hypothetical protein
MQKILINTAIGGYSLSSELIKAYLDVKNIEYDEHLETIFGEKEIFFMDKNNPEHCYNYYVINEVPRDDPTLIKLVEKLGIKRSSGNFASLKIVEIPDDVKWGIYCSETGEEHVYEQHRIWR